MPWQHLLKVMKGPFFQCFRQERVIGVSQSALGNVPGFVPSEARVVEQDPHQFRHGQRWVGVVELDRYLVGESTPVVVVAQEAPHEIG